MSGAETDGLTFEVRNGVSRVRVGVMDAALDAVSSLATPSTRALRQRSFDRFRTLINEAARMKLATLPAGFHGTIMLTKDDLRRVPPQFGTPLFGSVARETTRPAPAILGT